MPKVYQKLVQNCGDADDQLAVSEARSGTRLAPVSSWQPFRGASCMVHTLDHLPPVLDPEGVTAGSRAVSPCQEQEHVTGGGIMAANLRIPKAQLTGVYGAIVTRMSRKMLGEVPEPIEVAWHNRKVVNFSFSIARHIRKWNSCDEDLKSFAHMAVASMVGCSFCLDLGYFNAHNEGLDLTKAREVPRWRESDVFTPLERDVMEYAEAMTQTPPTVTDELSARLLAALGPAALVELTTYIALANFMTRGNVAFGIESQEFSAACGLKPLAVASTA
jgi:alkylhydroperoxidase family enzyme